MQIIIGKNTMMRTIVLSEVKMKKRIIIAIASAGLAALLALNPTVVAPVVEAVYCLVTPTDC